MDNARNELRRALRNHGKPKILCAVIQAADQYTENNVYKVLKNKKLVLRRGYTRKELIEFFKALNFEYNDGYGLQELEGTVWCTVDNGESTRTTWFSRHEYDGSEWWVYNDIPEIPPECNSVGGLLDWGSEDEEEVDQTWEDSPHLAEYLPFLPEAQDLQRRIEHYTEGWNDYGHFDAHYQMGFPLSVKDENGIWSMILVDVVNEIKDDKVVRLRVPFVEVTIKYGDREVTHELFDVPSLDKMDVIHCAKLFKVLHDMMLGAE